MASQHVLSKYPADSELQSSAQTPSLDEHLRKYLQRSTDGDEATSSNYRAMSVQRALIICTVLGGFIGAIAVYLLCSLTMGATSLLLAEASGLIVGAFLGFLCAGLFDVVIAGSLES